MTDIPWWVDLLAFFIQMMIFGLVWYGVWWTIKDAVKTAITESIKEDKS